MSASVSSQILIHRVPHNQDNPFLCVNQATVQDHRLSLSARGLLMYVLSLKDDWHIEPKHLARTLDLNVETVRKLIKELVLYGYIQPREKRYDALGQILWTDYQVYERPQTETLDSHRKTHKTMRTSDSDLTINETTMHGKTVHGETEPILNKDSRKKEKESPAEKSIAAKADYAPVGDSHADFASQSEGQTQPANAALVKAQDSLRSATLHDREKPLPVSVPRADQALAAPRTPPMPQSNTHSHSARATMPSSAPMNSEAKSSTPSSLPNHSHMQAVVAHAFKMGQGGYAGKIGQFLMGKLPPRRKDMWSQYQPETPASPQEIMALLSWYRQHPAYASSCAERGGKLPGTPSILRDRLDEFRDSEGYAQAMQAAQPLLDRLLRGETMTVPAAAKPANAMGPVESAAAYITYDPAKDPAYHRAVDPDALETLERLFGKDPTSTPPLNPLPAPQGGEAPSPRSGEGGGWGSIDYPQEINHDHTP